jgi:hypothetical protein
MENPCDNDDQAVEEIILSSESAVDPQLLVPPSLRHFGGAKPDVAFGALKFRIGRRPSASNLWEVYQTANLPQPEKDRIEVYNGYQQWLVVQAVGIIRDGGYERIDALGIEISFATKSRVAIRALFPQTQFITNLEGSIGLNCTANLNLSGSLSPSDLGTMLGKELPLTIPFASAGASFKVSGQANLVGRLSFAVCTPLITAIGTNDNECRWRFERDRQPLVGDHLLAMVVRAPRRETNLDYTVRISAEVSTQTTLWPWWRETDMLKSKTLKIQCPLN